MGLTFAHICYTRTYIWEQWLYRLLDATKILNVLFKSLLVAATFLYTFLRFPLASFSIRSIHTTVRWVCGSFLEILAGVLLWIVAHCCFIFSLFQFISFFSFCWLLLFAKSHSIFYAHRHTYCQFPQRMCVFSILFSSVLELRTPVLVLVCSFLHTFSSSEMIFWLAFGLLRYCKPQSSDGDFCQHSYVCLCVCVSPLSLYLVPCRASIFPLHLYTRTHCLINKQCWYDLKYGLRYL